MDTERSNSQKEASGYLAGTSPLAEHSVGHSHRTRREFVRLMSGDYSNDHRKEQVEGP